MLRQQGDKQIVFGGDGSLRKNNYLCSRWRNTPTECKESKLFEEQKVYMEWDDKREKWFFSIDGIQELPEEKMSCSHFC